MINIDTTKPVDRTGNSYCGLLVLAAIVGASTGEVAEMLAEKRRERGGVCLRSGKIKRVHGGRVAGKAITGTYESELLEFLADFGLKVEEVDVGARYVKKYTGWFNRDASRVRRYDPADMWPRPMEGEWTPGTWVVRAFRTLWTAAHSTFADGGTYIVNTPGHWLIVSQGKICETFTKGLWLPLGLMPQPRRKVLKAWRVS